MISNKDFVHMHCHSCYSQFDGLSQISDLTLQARKMGFKALALTDHGNIMGWPEFLKQCKAKTDKDGNEIPYPPLKPILGSEMYLSRQMNIGQYEPILDSNGKKLPPKHFQPDERKGNRHLNLYAMNWEGYKNLCTLSQKSWTQGYYYDPRIDLDLLSKHADGLMAGSACLSNIINVNLLHGRYKEAKKAAGIFKDLFKENFFLEVMYHGIPEEAVVIPDILKLSDDLDIPVVATNDCHFTHKHQAKSQEVLMAMSSGKCIKDPKRMRFDYPEFYLKSAEEMLKMFKHIPHVITNSVILAERIDTEDIERNLFGGMKLPNFDIPDNFNSSFQYLSHLAWEGMKKHGWENSDKHKEALKKELEDVRVAKANNNYDFATYFLIVRDYVNAAKERGCFVGPGRGSGFASVLLRCLDITSGPDPLGYGLIWERFLGFSNLKFIKESDFGFEEDTNSNFKLKNEDLEEKRELKDDLGGVDRY